MKVTISGETFDSSWELGRVSMADALAIEKIAGRRYVEWETELLNGSAEALAAFACLIWQRDGRETELKDILDGSAELDFSETFRSVMKAIGDAQAEVRAAEENPTSGAAPRTGPDGTPATPPATRHSSRKSST